MNLKHHIVSVFALALSVVPLAALGDDDAGAMNIQQSTYEGVPYLTGGVGLGEREYISEHLASMYNTKIELASSNGDYLASVKVDVVNSGGDKVLAVEADGPWLLAQLTPGNYRITATANGKTLTRSLKVDGHHTTRLVLSGWQEE